MNSEPISYASVAQSRLFLVATHAGTAWPRRFTANAIFVAAVFAATDEVQDRSHSWRLRRRRDVFLGEHHSELATDNAVTV